MGKQKVPVTVITGYLGSGKTTLLKRILENSKEKTAVLMNEFGDVGIDSKSVSGDNVEMKELLGGCVCCSLTGEFELAVKEILEKVKPKKIIVETTGVAEPDAMVINMENIDGVYLDSVVTLVDADSFLKFPRIGHTGRVQVEIADTILLNKMDLVDVVEIGKIENALRQINPEARIVKATYSNIETDSLFGINTEKILVKRNEPHEPSFTDSFVYKSDRMINKPRFLVLVSELPSEIYRAKGYVNFTDGAYLFNFVNGNHEISKSEDRKTELIFIGEGLMGVKDDILQKLQGIEM